MAQPIEVERGVGEGGITFTTHLPHRLCRVLAGHSGVEVMGLDIVCQGE
jgi:hypothetical protein